MSTYYIKQKKVSIRDIYYLYINKNEEPILEIIDNNYFGFLDNILGNLFSFSRKFVAKDTNAKKNLSYIKRWGSFGKNMTLLLIIMS